MDDLDIANTLSPSFPWLPYTASEFSEHQINGGNGDIGYLTQRSVMLEPIIEETSDDDDVSGGPGGHVWSHYDNQWSSESETGSVIRVELIQGKIGLAPLVRTAIRGTHMHQKCVCVSARGIIHIVLPPVGFEFPF